MKLETLLKKVVFPLLFIFFSFNTFAVTTYCTSSPIISCSSSLNTLSTSVAQHHLNNDLLSSQGYYWNGVSCGTSSCTLTFGRYTQTVATRSFSFTTVETTPTPTPTPANCTAGQVKKYKNKVLSGGPTMPNPICVSGCTSNDVTPISIGLNQPPGYVTWILTYKSDGTNCSPDTQFGDSVTSANSVPTPTPLTTTVTPQPTLPAGITATPAPTSTTAPTPVPDNQICLDINGQYICTSPENPCIEYDGRSICVPQNPPNNPDGGGSPNYPPSDRTSPDHPDNGGNNDGNPTNDPLPHTDSNGNVIIYGDTFNQGQLQDSKLLGKELANAIDQALQANGGAGLSDIGDFFAGANDMLEGLNDEETFNLGGFGDLSTLDTSGFYQAYNVVELPQATQNQFISTIESFTGILPSIGSCSDRIFPFGPIDIYFSCAWGNMVKTLLGFVFSVLTIIGCIQIMMNKT